MCPSLFAFPRLTQRVQGWSLIGAVGSRLAVEGNGIHTISPIRIRSDCAVRKPVKMDIPLVGGAAGSDKLIGPIALVVQLVLLAFFYKSEFVVSGDMNGVGLGSIYNFYVGVALMMFVGFGYLMTFLKSYGLGAVGYTMMITCVGVQVAIVAEVMMTQKFSFPLKIGMMSFMNGNFAVAAVLISFGGLIGKLSPTQAFLLTCIELKIYCANKVYFLTNYLNIADCGGTIIIHVFGAYFGLAACKAMGPKENDLNGSSYTSDLFSLVGTVFLWLYWPSFVAGGLTDATSQNYAIMNTVLALLASSVVTFALTPLIEKGKLTTVPIQNATLAGGVSIGATANLITDGAFGAVLVGMLAGAISCVGFCKPLIPGEVDTCGINNLHGMPGIFGGLVSVALPLLKVGPAVAMNQLLGLVGTLAIAGTTGFITGKILALFPSPAAEECFTDESFWDCADDISKK